MDGSPSVTMGPTARKKRQYFQLCCKNRALAVYAVSLSGFFRNKYVRLHSGQSERHRPVLTPAPLTGIKKSSRASSIGISGSSGERRQAVHDDEKNCGGRTRWEVRCLLSSRAAVSLSGSGVKRVSCKWPFCSFPESSGHWRVLLYLTVLTGLRPGRHRAPTGSVVST